jgi:hypothetical protein
MKKIRVLLNDCSTINTGSGTTIAIPGFQLKKNACRKQPVQKKQGKNTANTN